MMKICKSFMFLFLLFMLVNQPLAYSLDVNRAEEFTKNEILQLNPNAEELKNLSEQIKPDLNLKGALTEEEKEMLSAFFRLGFSLNTIAYNYVNYPLDFKLDGQSTKESLIVNLRELRDIMAELAAEDKLLELITQIITRIENENINSKSSDQQTVAMISKMYELVGQHIEDTFGLSYKIYYAFGIWTNRVMTICEERIIYDKLVKEKLSSKEKSDLWSNYTKDLKELLALSEHYKSSVKDLAKKAVIRNLENLRSASATLNQPLDVEMANRIYDYSLNVYYGLVLS